MTGGAEPVSVVRVAVVGGGWVAQHVWLPLLDRLPSFSVSAVVETDPAAAARVAELAPGAELLPDAAALDPAQTDLAVVAVPNHLHAPVAAGLLRRGLAVHVEKPVCLSTAELDVLAEAGTAGGGRLLAGSAARHRSDVTALAGVLPSLGTPRLVELSWIRARGIPRAGWFTQAATAGGGVLFDLGWHLLDVGLMLLGWPVIRQATGTTSAHFLRRSGWGADWRGDVPAGRAGDVEDTATGFLVTEDGTAILLRAGWASHQPHDRTTVRVHADGGVAELRGTFGFSPDRDPGPGLTVCREGVVEQVPLPAAPVGLEYERQVEALPAQLAGPLPARPPIEEARQVLDVLERLYRSARGG